ncbi:membrane-associating domain-containing protein [Hypoxylon trugodes]|uniref:membrane-associating domain-containing protein n=1 Tax=Hypoxylon trugodes TaxID=326681 RepID=UPI00219338D5|nr:membrane-associating domain-containing protein [Hypoxylon trugodes]KAI1388830.1 membrane-associating domain-containing protein [Hypoxylon trugodes]
MASSSIIILGIRAAQLLFAFIVMGLTAYVAHWYNVDTLTTSPSQVNWLLVVSVITIVSVLYLELTPRFAPKLSHPLVAMSLEVLNALFYFAGFIALSVFMSRLLFCRGSVCGAARAAIAFGAFEFLLWTGSAILMGKEVAKAGLPSFKRPTFGRKGSNKGPLNEPPMKETSAA